MSSLEGVEQSNLIGERLVVDWRLEGLSLDFGDICGWSVVKVVAEASGGDIDKATPNIHLHDTEFI